MNINDLPNLGQYFTTGGSDLTNYQPGAAPNVVPQGNSPNAAGGPSAPAFQGGPQQAPPGYNGAPNSGGPGVPPLQGPPGFPPNPYATANGGPPQGWYGQQAPAIPRPGSAPLAPQAPGAGTSQPVSQIGTQFANGANFGTGQAFGGAGSTLTAPAAPGAPPAGQQANPWGGGPAPGVIDAPNTPWGGKPGDTLSYATGAGTNPNASFYTPPGLGGGYTYGDATGNWGYDPQGRRWDGSPAHVNYGGNGMAPGTQSTAWGGGGAAGGARGSGADNTVVPYHINYGGNGMAPGTQSTAWSNGDKLNYGGNGVAPGTQPTWPAGAGKAGQ